jgi:uncharacterized membrane protein (UPF0127 family)
MDKNIINALNRIEDSLARDDKPAYANSYRDAMIASLVAKQFTLKDAQEIAKKNILMSTVHDMNFTLAVKNWLKVYDLELLNDEYNLQNVIETIEDDEPLTMLNQEVKEAFLCSRKLVKEITRLFKQLKNPDFSQSIATLFGKETQERAQKLVYLSFWCYKFLNSVDIEFTRQDGTTLTLRAELAATREESDTGLSKRPYIPDDAAMWYDEGSDAIQFFVTTDVVIPLSVAYVRSDGLITEIIDRKADDRHPYENKVPCRYVLEVPQGWFKKNSIQEGDYIRQKSIITEEKNWLI